MGPMDFFFVDSWYNMAALRKTFLEACCLEGNNNNKESPQKTLS